MIPEISVIIPYYNNASTIGSTLRTVAQQEYAPLEVILVNDASPDWAQGEKIVNTFVDLPLNVIHHPENNNGSAARNTGIKNAKGEYLAFLDADDEWLPNHLSTYIKLLNANNNKDLFYCRSIIKTDGFDDLVMPENGLETQNLSEYLFCNKGFIPTPSIFVSREMALSNLFNEDLIRHQDYDFLFRLNEKGIKFRFSEHIGVIVHWENNDTDKKGGTWQYSLNWAKQNRKFLTPKAYSYFMLKHVVYPQFKDKKRWGGLQQIFEQVNPFKIGIKDWYFTFSMLICGKIITPWKR